MSNNTNTIKPVLPKPIRYSQVKENEVNSLLWGDKYTMLKKPSELSLIHRENLMRKNIFQIPQLKAVKGETQKKEKPAKEITSVYCLRKKENKIPSESIHLTSESSFKQAYMESVIIKTLNRSISGTAFLLQKSQKTEEQASQRRVSSMQFIKFHSSDTLESSKKEKEKTDTKLILNKKAFKQLKEDLTSIKDDSKIEELQVKPIPRVKKIAKKSSKPFINKSCSCVNKNSNEDQLLLSFVYDQKLTEIKFFWHGTSLSTPFAYKKAVIERYENTFEAYDIFDYSNRNINIEELDTY